MRRLFENDPYTGHERLNRISPSYYADVREVQALWAAEGAELDELRAALERGIDDAFIQTADVNALARYERWFNVTYAGDMPSLEYRRATVASAFMATRHVGRAELIEVCGVFAPGQYADVGFDSGTVYVSVDGAVGEGGAGEKLSALERNLASVIAGKIPAHLGLNLSVRMRRAYRGTIRLSNGGAHASHLTGTFPEVGREAHLKIPIVYGAAHSSHLIGTFPAIQRTTQKSVAIKGGAFLHSYITSRLIN